MREVKVRQMPPKPFRERAKKMSADRTAEKIRDTAEVLMTKSLRTRPEHMLSTTSTESFFFFMTTLKDKADTVTTPPLLIHPLSTHSLIFYP